MKIINVKILGDNFRSLSSNKLYSFNESYKEDRLSTKVFAGLNGSGKSNFLELFSEIFYFLEINELDTVSESEKSNKNFGFEIEYWLPKTAENIYELFSDEITKSYEGHLKNNSQLFKRYVQKRFETLYQEELEEAAYKTWQDLVKVFLPGSFLHIRIEKQLGSKPVYKLNRQDGSNNFWEIKTKTALLLPTKIIAYTSGQNELLSNPYYKLKYHYFKNYEEKAKPHTTISEQHRLFFVDYNTNFSIFVANVLLADASKSKKLKSFLQIKDLHSFRITINTELLFKRVIPVNEALADNLIRLKQCATSWIEKKVGINRLLILDYLVNDETKGAFEFHFKTAFNLFKLFYELEIFNLYLVDKKVRDSILTAHKTYNISDEFSRPDPSRLVFRIEKIFIRKNIDEEKHRNIYYKALSDGEHQFNEVIGTVLMMEEEGCLFLIDEPDTHFNPKWRGKLIQLLNQMTATEVNSKGKIEKVRKQEIILTTHSPFVISDSVTEDVYRFTKQRGFVEYENPKIRTYGTSISILLDEIFEKEETISEMAKKELREMVDNIQTLDELKDVVNRLNTEFGDSVEKFDLFSKIKAIKDDLDKTKEN